MMLKVWKMNDAMQYLMYLHEIVAVDKIIMLYSTLYGHRFKLAFGALRTFSRLRKFT